MKDFSSKNENNPKESQSGKSRSRRFRVKNFRQKRKAIKLIHLFPNVLTSFNVACGVSAITVGIDQHFEIAAYLILLAAFFDLIDGKVARLVGSSSSFGTQLDSLADVISFGVAPSVLMHTMLYQQYDRFGISLVLVYTLCTALRLARYNVQASNQQKRDYFTGLPCPVPACFLAAVVLVSHNYNIHLENPILRTTIHVLMVCMAFLMVSTIRYPDLSSWQIEKKNIFQHNVIMVLVLCVTVMIAKIMVLLITFSFILSGPVKAIRDMKKQPQEDDQSQKDKQSPSLLEHKQ